MIGSHPGGLPMPRFLAGVPALLVPLTLGAQNRPQLSDTTRSYVAIDAPVVVLKHVRIIDGTGAGPKADQSIVIASGRIQTVGPAGSVTDPSGAQVVDLAG